jgi:ABC-2 type transport system ATP-binding protein
MSKIIIKTENLIKKYDSNFFALDGLNMNVPEGAVYGFVGRNGAGKTTTLRAFMSLLKPTSGHIEVLGTNPWNMPKNIREQIGYTSDSMQLIPWLKVGEMINCNASFYENWDKDYVEQWVKRLNLPLNKRVFSLSRGNRQKLGLVMAIGHRPKVLILDEPAGGLDPIARREFLESIIQLIHESGTTIVLSSHQMSDLERIAEHIGIIDNGKMKVETTLEELKETTRTIRIASKTKFDKPNDKDIIKFESFANAASITYKNFNQQKLLQIKQQFKDIDLQIDSLSLEEIFLAYIDN